MREEGVLQTSLVHTSLTDKVLKRSASESISLTSVWEYIFLSLLQGFIGGGVKGNIFLPPLERCYSPLKLYEDVVYIFS